MPVMTAVEDDEPIPEPTPDQFALMRMDGAGERPRLSVLPAMVGLSAVLVWRSARWRGLLIGVLQALGGIAVGAQLLVGNNLLSQALAVRQRGGSLSSLIPEAVTVGAIAALLAVINAVSNAQQRVVSELVATHAYNEIMSSAAAAELVAFEDPTFYDKLQRAAMGGQMRPWQLVTGLLNLFAGVLGAIGIGAALVSIKPVLGLITLAAAVPVWMAASPTIPGSTARRGRSLARSIPIRVNWSGVRPGMGSSSSAAVTPATVPTGQRSIRSA